MPRNRLIFMLRSLLLLGSVWLSVAQYSIANTDQESGVYPTNIILPTGPGTITGLGEAFTPHLNTGTSSQRLPVNVPPGRNGLTPDIALEYNSGFGNGIVGLGRRLTIPFIQRQTDKGLPNYSEWGKPDGKDNDHDGLTDEFDEFDTFIDHLGEELVLVADNLYRSKNSSSMARYQRLPQGWVVTQPDGSRWYFGQSAQARWQNPETNQGEQIFTWLLEKVEDTWGNFIDYDYQALDDSAQVYPLKITYNHGANGAMFVEFDYEQRPDILIDFKSGFELITAYRLKTVSVSLAERRLRTYSLDYHSVDEWQSQSLLASVTLSAGAEQMPPVEYRYTGYNAGEVRIAFMPAARDVVLNSPNIGFFDMNSDGLPDVLNTGFSQDAYWINEGPDSDGLPQWSDFQQMDTYSHSKLSDAHVKWADIDGDGKTEMLQQASGRTHYFQLDGNLSWQYEGELTGVRLPDGISSPVVRMLDINNDKRIDMVQTTLNFEGAVLSHAAQLNLPQGWGEPTEMSMPAGTERINFKDINVFLADMNGDGLGDLVKIIDGRAAYFPGRGLRGFGEEVVFANSPDTLYQLENIRLADMNNDGRTDLVYLNGIDAEIWLNLGPKSDNYREALFSDKKVVSAPRESGITDIRLVDINGNGSTDVVWHSPGELEEALAFAELFPHEQPHQLKSITNGIGGRTTFYYGTLVEEQIRDRNAGHSWRVGVPVAMQVLKKIVVEDGISQQSQVTHFEYHDGFYQGVEKEFRGFAATEERFEGDTTAPTLTTAYKYHVGDSDETLKGQVKHIETRDDSGNIFWDEDQQWIVRMLVPGYDGEKRNVSLALLTDRKQRWIEQGRGNPVTLAWAYEYDDYGNVTRLEELGRTDGNWQDERITVNRYTSESNSGRDNWILHLPIERKVTDLTGNVVAQEQWFYDDETYTGNNLGEVSAGGLTLHKVWYDPNQADAYVPAERYRYDQYGNRIDSYGALWGVQPGHHSEIIYEEQFYLYPITERVDTGQRTLTATAVYDKGLGVLTDYTDFNSQTIHYRYDALGRLTSVTQPGDSLEAPTIMYNYHLAQPVEGGVVNWVEARQRETAGGGTVDSRTYYDGLSRTLMVRSEGEYEDQVVVSGQHQFNARGNIHKQYFAYFSQGLDYKREEIDHDFIEFRYDALERRLVTTQPYIQQDNGVVYSRITYEPFSTLIEDEEQTRADSLHPGAAKRLVYDGLLNENGEGRLRQVDEIVGLNAQGEPTALSTWSTYYDYDLLGNFTRLQDAQGNVTYISYDALGRRYFINDPNRGQHWQFFDSAGNLLAARDAKGQERHYRYDGANRLLNEYHLSFGGAAPKAGEMWKPDLDLDGIQPVVSYQYDSLKGSENQFLLGRLAKVVDPSGFEQLGYDARGRIRERHRKVQGHGVDSQVYSTHFSYDSADRTTRHQFADGTWIDYHYNARGLLEKISGVVESLDYTAAGRLTQSRLSNGVSTNWLFDERHRLVSLNSVRAHDDLDLQQLDYHFDAVSNLLEVADNRSMETLKTLAGELKLNAEKAPLLSQTFSYAYDDLYRLIEAGVDLSQYQYRYDLIGNLLEKTNSRLLSDTQSTVFRYGNSADNSNGGAWNREGRGTSEGPGPQALTWADGPIVYDTNGNQIEGKGQHYQWDPDNRLISVVYAEATSLYGYDYQNKRRYKVVEHNSGARTQVIYLDDSSELRDGRMVKYVSLGAHRVARSTQEGGVFTPSQYYLHNHLGSTALTLNSQGEVLNAFIYKPYGELEQEFGSTELAPYRFTGKEQDSESGLGYFDRRYLSSAHGRFLTPDPVFELPGRFVDPQRWSPYAYARNNPVGYLDPNGESIVKAAATAGKLAWKAYNQYRKTGQFDKASLKKVGMDEVVGIADDLNTVFLDGNASTLDKVGAAADLIAGTEFSEGELSDFRPGAKKDKRGVCCFVAGTLILTQGGYKAIEEIELGELVFSKDVETGEQDWKPVTQLFKKHRRIYELIIVSESGEEKLIETTDDHPFYVLGRNWVNTVDLFPGNQIETDGYGWALVQFVRDANRYDVTYNLEVADFHTYYATKLNLLVHNCPYDSKDTRKADKLSSPNPVPKSIREAYEEIRLGRGTPNLDANGVQKIYQGRENAKWKGATEWLVPGDNRAHHRVLKLGDKLGYVKNHDYSKIKTFPGPWYPEGGKK